MGFPFTIEDEMNLLPLKNVRGSGNSRYVDCPFCHKKAALHIALNKNIWNCMSCQMKGSYKSGGGLTELYGKFYNLSNQEAYHAICDQLVVQSDHTCAEKNDEKIQKASPRERDRAYRALLSMLSLSDCHRENLKKRGLDDESIEKYMYRSVPITGYQNLMNSITQYHIRLNGVPGFYTKDGAWRINLGKYAAGIFCPIIDREGYIVAMQIRLDRPMDGRKFIWLSSDGKENGCSCGSPVHFAGDPLAKTILLTEGSMKANVAHELSGKLFRTPSSFVAVTGVSQFNSIKQLFKDLKDYGCEVVYDCLDMDKFQNPNVYRALQKIYEIAFSIGLTIKPYRWVTIIGSGKGLVDGATYKILKNDTEFATYSYQNKEGKQAFSDKFYVRNGRLLIPEPIIDSKHPHENVKCKLINTENGDYQEFIMNVDKNVSKSKNLTFVNRKGIDDYLLSGYKEQEMKTREKGEQR